MTLNYLILINGRKCPEEVSMRDEIILLISSIMVGVGIAALIEGVFPILVNYPLMMSITGGIISGATYYTIHWLSH